MIAYYDANFAVKLYIPQEAEAAKVDRHANTLSQIFSAEHSRAEVASALFRKMQGGEITPAFYVLALSQFQKDISTGFFVLLPATAKIYDRVDSAFAAASAIGGKTFLRGADALHLATAAESSFADVFSADRHLLAAAPLFGIRGVALSDLP